MSDIFSNHPALKNIHPVKLRLLQEISRKARGHSVEDMLPQIMMVNKELKRRNLEFTKSESDLLMEVLMQNMSPADRKKFMMLRSFMNE